MEIKFCRHKKYKDVFLEYKNPSHFLSDYYDVTNNIIDAITNYYQWGKIIEESLIKFPNNRVSFSIPKQINDEGYKGTVYKIETFYLKDFEIITLKEVENK